MPSKRADFKSPVSVVVTLEGHHAFRLEKWASLGRTLDNTIQCLERAQLGEEQDPDDIEMALEDLKVLQQPLDQLHYNLRQKLHEAFRTRLVPENECDHERSEVRPDSFRYCVDCRMPWGKVPVEKRGRHRGS